LVIDTEPETSNISMSNTLGPLVFFSDGEIQGYRSLKWIETHLRVKEAEAFRRKRDQETRKRDEARRKQEREALGRQAPTTSSSATQGQLSSVLFP
jgi:hypothetical protein